MAIVGSSVVVGKLVVATVPVFLIGGLRFALAALILLPMILISEQGVPRLSRRDLGVLVLQAFTGIFLFNTLLLYGLTFSSAAESGIVTSTTPAVVAVLSVLLLREPWTRARALGVALAVAGLLAINLGGSSGAERGPRPGLGNLLVFAAVVAEGLFVVCSRVLAQRLSPLVVATGISVLGLLMFAPFAVHDARRVSLAHLGASEWMAIGYYGVVVTVLAFLLWARGIARVPASTAAVFTGVLPVSAVTLSYLVLGERVLASHLVGAACVIAGIVLVAREGGA
ncbi:MAG TPA: DMT family transporter [Methylomirabilota bacterium]|jgi:drug/metabolite transporter (DMT)-like permease